MDYPINTSDEDSWAGLSAIITTVFAGLAWLWNFCSIACLKDWLRVYIWI